ncbi:MAG: LPS assembly protein LptD [Pseudomonadota bacterium]
MVETSSGWAPPRARAAALVALALLLAAPAPAQTPDIDPDQPVTLLADRVEYDSDAGQVIAIGNVEVFFGQRTLTAARIVYDDNTRRIAAEGDIVLRDEDGTTIFADEADLDADLRDGLIKGAKALLDQQAKLAAVEGQRVDDRYNILNKVTYSPCDVCSDEPTPLWRIRARRVIHDQEDNVVHYESARLEVFGVPVLWTPYFSHPDPTVDRATGFLSPSLSTSTNYGYGLKTPFYWAIDDRTDVTLTPFITNETNPVGLFEFRRAFANGDLRVAGSLTQADFTGEDAIQGNLDTQGRFRNQGIDWGWDIQAVTDDDYLRFYDLSSESRLTSEIYARSYTREGFFDLAAVRFQSLRVGETPGLIPLALPDFEARRDLADDLGGGRLALFGSARALRRNNDGLDSERIGLGLDWSRQEILPIGLALTGFAEVRADVFRTSDRTTPGPDDTTFRFAPLAGVEARFPLVAEGVVAGTPVSHVIEPIAQAIVAPFATNDAAIANEDSLITEFDELNLFDTNRFSGSDRVEEGPRLDLGLRYALLSSGPVGIDASVGRSLRFEDSPDFTAGSGLREAQSDWVAGWSLRYDPYLSVRQRLRFGGDDNSLTRNAVSISTGIARARLTADYVFLAADSGTGVDEDREEIAANVFFGLTPEWSVTGNIRHDIERDALVEFGGSVRFANECCTLRAFVRRNFTATTNAPASTSFGVEVELLTLGGGGIGP